jgi:hypothetical protein
MSFLMNIKIERRCSLHVENKGPVPDLREDRI